MKSVVLAMFYREFYNYRATGVGVVQKGGSPALLDIFVHKWMLKTTEEREVLARTFKHYHEGILGLFDKQPDLRTREVYVNNWWGFKTTLLLPGWSRVGQNELDLIFTYQPRVSGDKKTFGGMAIECHEAIAPAITLNLPRINSGLENSLARSSCRNFDAYDSTIKLEIVDGRYDLTKLLDGTAQATRPIRATTIRRAIRADSEKIVHLKGGDLIESSVTGKDKIGGQNVSSFGFNLGGRTWRVLLDTPLDRGSAVKARVSYADANNPLCTKARVVQDAPQY